MTSRQRCAGWGLLPLLCLIVWPVAGFGAEGDILGVRIETNGWQAAITMADLDAGGTYVLGLGADNTVDPPAEPRVVLTVTSPGFDDGGQPTRLTHTLYGTRFVRKAFPDQAQADETVGNREVTVKVALSDVVNPGDIITATVGSGFYTQGGRSSRLATDFPTVNDSALPQAKVVGNWSWPGWERVAGSSFRLRCVAFHRSGQAGRPVRAVKFWAVDQHGRGSTNLVTTPTIETDLNDAVPIVEYVGELTTADLTQGDVLTCNFKAYPWVGDEAATLDTSDGVHEQPTPLYAPIDLVCDPAGTYGQTVAVVDAAVGDDSTGRALDAGAFDVDLPPPAFATISGAAAAIFAFNDIERGRGDVGGGIIYLRQGHHGWTGGSRAYGAVPRCWLTLRAFPGLPRNAVVLDTQIGDRDISGRLKLDGLTVTVNQPSAFDGIEALWFHDCHIDCAGSSQWIADVRLVYVTASTIANWGDPDSNTSGIRAQLGYNMSPVLIRGNELVGMLRHVTCYTCLGNRHRGPAGDLLTFRFKGANDNCPLANNAVFAFNQVFGWRNTANALVQGYGETEANLHGAAVVQNLLENTGSGPGPLLWMAADGSTFPVHHVMVWQNSLVGQRMNCAYNDVGSEPAWRLNWSLKQNLMYKHAIKSDTFGAPDPGRVGNWMVVNGVGAVGNMYAEIEGVSGAGSFLSEFTGLSSHQPRGTSPSGNWLQFAGPKCFDGINEGAGGGDYHLLPASPAFHLGRESLLLWDLEGRPRRASDPPGALGSGVVEELSLAIVLTGDVLTLSFPTTPGMTYRLESSDDLTQIDWSVLEDGIAGTGSPHTWQGQLDPFTAQFFRVRSQP